MTIRLDPAADAAARLRTLEKGDLPAAHALSAALRWPHRLEDWEFFLELGEGLAVDVNGALAGTTIGWRYGEAFATIGMVIVADAAQGRGFGRALAGGVLERLGRRTVLLNATVAGAPLYRSLGFAPTADLRQHQGAPFSVGLMPLPAGHRLRPLGRSDAATLTALDAAASGMPRAALMAALLATSDGVVLDHDDQAVGFALIRRFGRGQVIGPVVAPDAEGARALIGHWLASRDGHFIRVDVPVESGLSPWLESLGLEDAGLAMGMVRGVVPQPEGPARNFALVSQALG